MTLLLQGAFVAAAALTWLGVAISAVGLWRVEQGRPAHELHAHLALEGGSLFAGPFLVIATARNGFGAGEASDVLLFTAVFGLGAATSTWLSERPALRSRLQVRRALQRFSYALPLGAGLLAGITGIP